MGVMGPTGPQGEVGPTGPSGENDAALITYDNSGSDLTSTNIKDAIDELDTDKFNTSDFANLDRSIIPDTDETYDLGSPTNK